MDQTLETKSFNFQDTTATKRIFSLRKRIRAVSGGTSSSKTISILIWLIDYSQVKQSKEKLASVISETHPHLEKGAILDFQNIMKDRGYWKEERWNQSKHTYTFETGNKLEFYSVDTYGKAHGPRRDVLFLNEANNLEYKIVDQLIIRTREIVWMDWNPSEEFWFYTEMLPSRDDIDFIGDGGNFPPLTYLDNEALDPVTISEIESHRGNKQWWQVYGLGLLGEITTRIYTGWRFLDEVPFEARLIRYGLDFGYTNDPTSIVAIYYYNGAYILDEVCHAKRLSNKMISDIFTNNEKALIIADSAEPKSIDELRGYQHTVLPCKKGQGSVNQGIQYVQDMKISLTKRSTEMIKEYRNYVWLVDEKTGEVTNEPTDVNNHSMDALRYGLASIKNPNQVGAHVHYPQSNTPRNNLNPFQTTIQTIQGLPPELQDEEKPRSAYVHTPNLNKPR